MTTLINNIHSTDWQPKLDEIGAVVENIEDINQCIRIILTTPKGSDPHRPTFGSDLWRYIDYPVKQAIPNIIREAVDAITAWETRVDVKSIRTDVNDSTITMRIEWVFKNTDAVQSIEVTV